MMNRDIESDQVTANAPNSAKNSDLMFAGGYKSEHKEVETDNMPNQLDDDFLS